VFKLSFDNDVYVEYLNNVCYNVSHWSPCYVGTTFGIFAIVTKMGSLK